MRREAGETATRLLKDLVEDEVLGAYKELLVRGGCQNSEAAELLGGPEMVDVLTESGMAYVEPAGLALEPRLMAIPPELALQSSLAAISRKLIAKQERLLEGHRRMADVRPFPGTLEAETKRSVRVLTDRSEIGDVSRALLGTARHGSTG
ncbi:hypothetical protein ACQEU3_37640 [Spirillospora sp. CA-253888]